MTDTATTHRPITATVHVRLHGDHRAAFAVAADRETLRALTACWRTVHPRELAAGDAVTCPTCTATPMPETEQRISNAQARVLTENCLGMPVLATTTAQHETRIVARLTAAGLLGEREHPSAEAITERGRAALAAHAARVAR